MPGARPVEHGFDPAWLRRREPLDRAARAGALARGFAAAIPAGPDGVRRVVDLAAGAGANFRALAPLLDGDQDWTLVDHDARLLDEQARAIAHWARDAGWHVDSHPTGCLIDTGRARWRVRRADVDLARDLERVSLEDFDAVTCAAFLDLVSDAWIVRLCAWLARSPRPLLAVLTVDGRRVWSPADPSDADVQASFARHQRGDKGFGPALGGAAVASLARGLAATGFEVRRARSDWAIGADDDDLLGALLDETTRIALAGTGRAQGAPTNAADRWAAARRSQFTHGRLSLVVGHEDLLAIPVRRNEGDERRDATRAGDRSEVRSGIAAPRRGRVAPSGAGAEQRGDQRRISGDDDRQRHERAAEERAARDVGDEGRAALERVEHHALHAAPGEQDQQRSRDVSPRGK